MGTCSSGNRGERRCSVLKQLISRLVRDEQGGEVLEYAIVAGLIVVAALVFITSVGSKVAADWTSLNSGMN
jgi:Flp pilus assembly pilin Flp